MNPTPVIIALASGRPTYRGKAAPSGGGGTPAWRTAIAAGKFADISTNTMYSVRPTGWPTTDISGPFLNWSGAIIATDFSALGGYDVYGSGHLSEGAPLWAGNWVFNLSTLGWVGTNVPSAPLLQDATKYSTDYYVSTETATAGHIYPGHTYTGNVYQSAAEGGGTKGSMLSFFIGGGSANNMVNKFDLSSASAAPSRVINAITLGGSTTGAYPMCAKDDARGGTWVMNYSGGGPLTFVKHSDWSITTYPAVGFNVYGDQCMMLLPAPHDCLVTMGHDTSGGPMVVRVIKLNGLTPAPSAAVVITQTGTACPDTRCGGDWCAPLGSIVSYEGGGSYDVYRLTPPAAANVTTASWAWTHETVVGMAGQAPSNPGINPNNGLPYTNNGTWSKFKYVASVNAFIWCGGVNSPVQAFVLQGM